VIITNRYFLVDCVEDPLKSTCQLNRKCKKNGNCEARKKVFGF